MKRLLFTVCFLICWASLIQAEQFQKYWIYFRDKGENASSVLSKTATPQHAAAIGLSDRALARRAKTMPAVEVITMEDLPVAPFYLQQLNNAGITIQNTSRWFNAATAYLTDARRARAAALSCVAAVEPVRAFVRRDLPASRPTLEKLAEPQADALHSYGNSLTQVTQIHVPDVHNVRITGRGVLVGMLDSGFRWRVNEATKNMAVIKEYDFIQKDTITANEDGKTPVDETDQDSHGTLTMSVVGGYKEGTLVSPAFGAQFILAKTEYIPTETNVEEDNWVAGIEWEESYGVDVVSSSLGYNEFDAGQKSYVYADMNGRTATTSKAAVKAARRGVVVVSAMGNEGASSWHYLTSPADADSIISVGAVSSAGNIVYFSSVGPTSDGRIKPDVVAQGISTWGATVQPTGYSYSQGTSLSTPLVAGAAALVLSAHPELTPIQVRDALRNTATNAAAPNNNIGWGIINTYEAMLYHGMVLSTDPEIVSWSNSESAVRTFVLSKSIVARGSVKLYYCTNIDSLPYVSVPMTLSTIVDRTTNSGKYTAVLPASIFVPKTHFYISALDATNKRRTAPYNAPTNSFILYAPTDTIHQLPTQFVLNQNYPNPFNPSTTISYRLPTQMHVRLEVYNLLGQHVTTLVNEEQCAENQSATFNGADYASGMYIYRLTAGSISATKTMMLLK
jgi:subtilisin family serine protease